MTCRLPVFFIIVTVILAIQSSNILLLLVVEVKSAKMLFYNQIYNILSNLIGFLLCALIELNLYFIHSK